ncbi:MAG: enoyl-CoA hydratase-related protein [Acidimicrobiales bacterium]
MLTGRFVDAEEALAMGLVTTVADDVLAAAFEQADLILANSPFGVQMTKEVMWSQLEIGSLQAGIDLENRTQLLASTTEDLAEAMQAFVEKRPPVFGDR